MKLRERKKRESGSALLVVLGFLSFMVVSAVAFAIYMRSERVPSSALRRNVATRHLVKAAMAQAMSRVDDAIRNDPFPGLANTNENVFTRFYHDKDNNSMDLWLGRVFMPPDPAGLLDDGGAKVAGANDPNDLNKFAWRFAPVTETVSVLNLEGLGYLPPALVNDVRFLSRSSYAAKWQNFAFDAGRFAFCAVNVSDYFDINRTSAGKRSSPLDARISLLGTLTYSSDANQDATLTDGNLTTLEGQLLGPIAARPTYSNPDRNAGSAVKATTEYVSLLDYNLALGSKYPSGIGPIYSPFYNWVKKGSENYFYGGTVRNSTGALQARRQPFVADSFEAIMDGGVATNVSYGEGMDLATYKGQPFYGLDMSGNLTEGDVARATSGKCLQRMYNTGLIGEADPFTLYDYLDHDDVPLSLAMPSVECVPMVTAVELVGNNMAKLKVNPPTTPNVDTPTTPGPGTRITTKEYKLDPSSFDSAAAGVRVLLAYPFRHFRGRNAEYKVQVAMKVFVASGNVSVRPEDGLSALHPNPENNAAEWKLQSKAFTIDGNAPGDALSWTLYSDMVNVTLPTENKTQDDALIQVDVTRWSGSANVPADQTFFTQIIEEPGTVSPTGVFTPSGRNEKYKFNLRPFKDGTLLPGEEIPVAAGSPPPYSLDQFRTYAMLWVRVVDADDKTVDLAPAVVADDMLNNKRNEFGVIGGFGGTAPGCLLFSSDPANAFTYANMLAGTFTGLDGSDPKWLPKALATVDPRYNYAPEDWFAWDQSISKSGWLNKVFDAGYFNVQGNRDPDIFMFTSNQGYLQTPGEFAFLPRLSEWNNQPGSRIPSIIRNAPGASATAKHADRPEDILNSACAWRTYPVDRTIYEDFVKVGIGRGTDGIATVNPYSDDAAVLRAVFAYTPCDYWTAGRIVADKSVDELATADFGEIVRRLGDSSEVSGDKISAKDCVKYSFSDRNNETSSQMQAKEVNHIVNYFKEVMRAESNQMSADNPSVRKSWEEIFDELPWFKGLDGQDLDPQNDDSFRGFFGQKLDKVPLYSIDRKFLYSYWRDCFANKQQLFLIFVRAESTALGGPGEGTPSQQGGRAVALVWREPTAYSDGSNPGNTYTDNIGQNDIRSQEFRVGRRPHRMRVLFYHQFD